MGRVTETVTIQNYNDIIKFKEGFITEDKIRTVKIDAIVDTGATYLCLPPKVIKELGLVYLSSSSVRTGNGTIEFRFFGGAHILIRDRFTQMLVMENKDDSVPALIGYLVLEAMDYVVNPNTQEITGNPEHGGKWMADMF